MFEPRKANHHWTMGYKLTDSSDGIHTWHLDTWKNFYIFLEERVLSSRLPDPPAYVWRGQRDTSWSLSTTLDRVLERQNLLKDDLLSLEDLAADHLEAFKLATRGRRGHNPASLEDLEWWALGQHFGLATPLLDWTRSPFAAAYFAYENATELRENANCAVYALNIRLVEERNLSILNGPSLETGRAPTLQVLDSLSNENPRLVSQGGLFTRAPIGMSIERWISDEFEGSAEAVLLKIEVPSLDRAECLRDLETMNINHASLFPDLLGASRATNLRLELYAEGARP